MALTTSQLCADSTQMQRTSTQTARRIRGHKVHIWMNNAVLRDFDQARLRSGLSRDGAFEQAALLFISEGRRNG